VQKIFNFPEYLADRLRDEALLRSHEKGRRVTEKDLVVETLEKLCIIINGLAQQIFILLLIDAE